MLKFTLATLVLLSAVATPAGATNYDFNADFSDFRPEVRYGVCYKAFTGEAASLQKLLKLQELFTEAAQTKNLEKAETALYRAALSASRSWHLPTTASRFVGAYAEAAEGGPLAAHCHTWFQAQEAGSEFAAPEVDQARKKAHEYFADMLSRMLERKASAGNES